jgi:acetoin utilization deacetylase AcuC-like enzyme
MTNVGRLGKTPVTGIFFHYQMGERLRDFPQALESVLSKDNVFLYDALYPSKPHSPFDLDPIPLELICRVHTPEMVERVKRSSVFDGALFSAAGTVAAAVKIWTGEITNAFVFTGYGDHHAGSQFFGGGCYLNGAAIAIAELRHRFQAKRFAIIDTDAHHGDGTWEIFEADPDVLYVCFCTAHFSERNNKVNVQVTSPVNDAQYLDLVRANLVPRLEAFDPEVIFWNWGYDGIRGEYGNLGLSPDSQAQLARELRGMADRFCSGSIIVVLCGGSRRDLARYLIPGVIQVLVQNGNR